MMKAIMTKTAYARVDELPRLLRLREARLAAITREGAGHRARTAGQRQGDPGGASVGSASTSAGKPGQVGAARGAKGVEHEGVVFDDQQDCQRQPSIQFGSGNPIILQKLNRARDFAACFRGGWLCPRLELAQAL